MRSLPLLALAGCIGIPGPTAGGDPDAGTEPPTVTCDRSLGELLPSPAFEGVANVLDVVVADLDRDGFDDVIALLEPDLIAIARSRSDGDGFLAPVEIDLHTDLRALATVDLDGDFDVDVVAAGLVAVVLRNDAGKLVEEARQPAGCEVDTLVTGQFDDDARPDVVSGCTSGAVMLMRHGDTTPLAAPTAIDTFTGLRGVAAGDITGDARDDLVVVGTGGVELLRAIGGGAFARTHVTDAAAPAVAAGDLDADGRDDVIAWTGDGLAWLRGGETSGAFVPLTPGDMNAPLRLELGAIDGNPGDDIVLVEGDINGALGRTMVITSPLTDMVIESQPGIMHRRCRLGRLDASDAPDLACINLYGPVLVSVIHRGAVPAVSRPFTVGAVLGQFDTDLALEVLTTRTSIELLQPAGDRFTVEASNPAAVIDGEPIAAVDWTRDGRTDLVMHTYPDNDGAIVLVPAATAPATFEPPVELVDVGWVQPVVGDLDEDGYVDLAGWTLPEGSDPVLHVAFGGPGGVFSDTIRRTGLRSVAIADVIAGGAPELIVANGESELQFVDLSDRTLSIEARVAAAAYPIAVVASDLDTDGDADLVTLEIGEGLTSARTYLRGDDRFEAGSAYAMRGWIDDLVVADVDGDGAPDVLADAVMFLRGQGDGRLAPPVPFARPSALVGSVRAPAGAAEQLIYLSWPTDGVSALEMLAPGCK